MIWGFLIVKMPSVSCSKLESGGWFQYSSLTTMWLCMFTFFHAPPLWVLVISNHACKHCVITHLTDLSQQRQDDKQEAWTKLIYRHGYEPEATWCSEHVWSYDHSHIPYNSYTHGTFLGLWLKTNIANNVLRRSVGLMDLIFLPGT